MGASISILEEHRDVLKARFDNTAHMSNADRMKDLEISLRKSIKNKANVEAMQKREEAQREEKERKRALLKEEEEKSAREEARKLAEEKKNPRLAARRKKGMLGGSWNRVGLTSIPRPRSMENFTTTKTIEDTEFPEAQAEVVQGPQSVDVEGDSWDSAFHQPSCPVCSMAFQSKSRLDTHIKYSVVHATNVRTFLEKANSRPRGDAFSSDHTDNESGCDTSSVGGNLDVDIVRGSMVTGQQEGVHFKMLYSGHKLFFRTQETLELRIFLHLIPGTVEITAYDTLRNREVPRLYFQYEDLHRALLPAVRYRMKQKNREVLQALHSRKRYGGGRGAPAKPMTQEEMERQAFASALVSRIYQAPKLSGSSTTRDIEVVPLSPLDDDYYVGDIDAGDEPGVNLKPLPCPSSAVPVAVAWRRRSTSQEINNFLSEVELGHASLRESVEKASRISGTVLDAVDLLKKSIDGQPHLHRDGASDLFPEARVPSKYMYVEGNMPSGGWVRLFQWAVRKVILQKRVAKTKLYLELLELRTSQLTVCTDDAISSEAAGPSSLSRKGRDTPGHMDLQSPTKIKRTLMRTEA